MSAAKVINQLAWLAKDGGLVQVIVQHPTIDTRELAAAVLRKVPGAWRPAGGGAGALVLELALHGGLTARWHVHDVACPLGWVELHGDQQSIAELSAGHALLEVMRDELLAAQVAHDRIAAGAN